MSHRRSYRTLVLWTVVTLVFLICSSAVLAGQASGLVAAYAFNETSGTTTADASGTGNNGTLTNGALFAAGKNGNGLGLDGANDYVNLANPVSLRITGSMTVSAWINSSSFPLDDAVIVSKRQSSDAGYQLDTTVDTGPRTIGFKISNAGSNVARYGATTLSLNTWYHLAGVYDATNRTLNVYLNGQLDNGVLVGTIPASQPTSTQNVNIGRRPGIPNTFNFAGKIDDVRIYNRALTQAEIQTDMNTPVAGSATNTAPTITSIAASDDQRRHRDGAIRFHGGRCRDGGGEFDGEREFVQSDAGAEREHRVWGQRSQPDGDGHAGGEPERDGDDHGDGQ